MKAALLFVVAYIVVVDGSKVARYSSRSKVHNTHAKLKDITPIKKSSVRRGLGNEPLQLAQTLFNTISAAMQPNEQGNQFAFIILQPISGAQPFIFTATDENLQIPGRLRSLKTATVFPASAKANLVIAGVTADAPEHPQNHAETKIINVMPIMDRVYFQKYRDTSKDCPYLIMLGSRRDPCYVEGGTRCANNYITEKKVYVQQTNCHSTRWYVYVKSPGKGYGDFWQQSQQAYADNGITVLVDP